MKTLTVMMLGGLLSITSGCALDAIDGANADQTSDSEEAISSFELLRGSYGGYGDHRGDHDDGYEDHHGHQGHDDHHGHCDHHGHHGHGHDHGNGSPAVRGALSRGADRLASLQADTIGDNAHNGLNDNDPDDGGWDFTISASATSHTTSKSPTNLFGEIGMGEWAALDSGNAGNRALTTMLDAGTAMQHDPDIDSPPDFVFGVLLADLANNPGFAQIARQHYDAKLVAFGGAVGLGTAIQHARHAGHEDGVIAYDLGWLILSAAALETAFPNAGYAADADTYAGLVVDDLTAAAPLFNFHDTTEGSYIIGLAWSQIATARLGERALLGDLRTQLLGQQHANGAWSESSALPADDLQSTALALSALALTGRATAASQEAATRTANFLVSKQAASGGWPVSATLELPLVDAEVMLALMLSQTDAGKDGVVPGAGTPLAAAAKTAPVVITPAQ